MAAKQLARMFWWHLLFTNAVIFAQLNITASLDSATYFLAHDKLSRAQNIFELILEQDKANLPARSGLGEIAFRQHNWRKVKSHFAKVLKVEPANPAALYYSGIAFRETGKYKGPLLRELDLSKSINRLRDLTTNNPDYKDCFYQLALTFREKERYETTIELIQQQLEIKPELDSIHVDLLRHYRSLIRHRDRDEAALLLAAQQWPQAA